MAPEGSPLERMAPEVPRFILRLLTEMMRESGKEAIALPLRFALEDWLMGGSQCLVGYIDGHLHWDRHVEKLVKRTGTTATQRHQEDEEESKSLKENCQEVPIEIEVPDLLAPSPRPPLPLMELPKSPEIPDARSRPLLLLKIFI
jgi:hypothetical protein